MLDDDMLDDELLRLDELENATELLLDMLDDDRLDGDDDELNSITNNQFRLLSPSAHGPAVASISVPPLASL